MQEKGMMELNESCQAVLESMDNEIRSFWCLLHEAFWVVGGFGLGSGTVTPITGAVQKRLFNQGTVQGPSGLEPGTHTTVFFASLCRSVRRSTKLKP